MQFELTFYSHYSIEVGIKNMYKYTHNGTKKGDSLLWITSLLIKSALVELYQSSEEVR